MPTIMPVAEHSTKETKWPLLSEEAPGDTVSNSGEQVMCSEQGSGCVPGQGEPSSEACASMVATARSDPVRSTRCL